MDLGLLHPYISLRKPAKWMAKEMTRPSVLKYDKLENDAFIKSRLSVQSCAESFCISRVFKDLILNVDIDALDIVANKKDKTVTIKNSPKLAEGINEYIGKIPEFFNIFIPKVGEEGLAQHVLSTYQKLIRHPEYKKCSIRQQKMLENAALNHDNAKAFNSEPSHAAQSAKMTAKSLEKQIGNWHISGLTLKLIKHHHYSWSIKNKVMTYQNYAEIFNKEEFRLLKILIDADILSKPQNAKNIERLKENEMYFQRQAEVFEEFNKSQKTLQAKKTILIA